MAEYRICAPLKVMLPEAPKAPDTPVLYELEWSGPTAELIWHVYYGNSRNDAKLKVDVNASTGEFIHAVK